MTRSTAITRTRGRRSALAYGSRSTTAAEDNLNRLGTPRAGTLLDRRQVLRATGQRAALPDSSPSPATVFRFLGRFLLAG